MRARKSRASKKAQLFTESVIREMTRLADQYGAINLAQGMPDFDAPAKVKGAAAKAIRDNLNQYATTWGSAELREAIAEKSKSFNGIDVNPETDITVTCGSTEAMTDSIIAVADPGEEVVIPEPFYENYVPATIIAGAKPRHVTLREPGFGFDEEELRPHSILRRRRSSSIRRTTLRARSSRGRSSRSSPTCAPTTTRSR
jgi:aminotransferase